MFSTRRIATVALAVAALLMVCAGFAWPPVASATAVQPTIGSVAQQLGVKVPRRETDSFDLGVSFTGLLEKPDRLAAFGIADMKEGARGVVARVALDRVVVEADQLEPARSARVKLALDVAGRLSAPPRT